MQPLSAGGPHGPQKYGERFRHEAKSSGDLFGDLLGPQGGALSASEIEALVEPPGSPRWKVVRVVFVDEASLVPSAVMRALLAVAHRKGIKVVIFGDPFQLGAVEVNEERPFEPLKSPHVAMRDVVRQGAGGAQQGCSGTTAT